MNLVEKARLFAIARHKDTRYGKLPYEYHLRRVVAALGDVSEVERAAGWLHDVVEDTATSLFEIREMFGGTVARLVDCVTDEPGDGRAERKAGMYRKLAAGPAAARRLKLADRAENMQASIENPKMASMYRDEFSEFIRIAGTDPQNSDLVMRLFWLHLDSLDSAA